MTPISDTSALRCHIKSLQAEIEAALQACRAELGDLEAALRCCDRALAVAPCMRIQPKTPDPASADPEDPVADLQGGGVLQLPAPDMTSHEFGTQRPKLDSRSAKGKAAAVAISPCYAERISERQHRRLAREARHNRPARPAASVTVDPELAAFIEKNGVKRYEPGTQRELLLRTLEAEGHQVQPNADNWGRWAVDGKRLSWKKLLLLADRYRIRDGLTPFSSEAAS